MRVVSEDELRRIVSALPGTPRVVASFIVTEQGTAQIWGHDGLTRAQHILDHAAHPAARDDLRKAGRELGLSLR